MTEEILEEIKKIKTQFPELRIGQIIGNAVGGGDIFYTDDKTLLKLLRGFYYIHCKGKQ